jgi:nitrite reductase/ring-hydroxylating ferredoxin subunit
MAGGGGQAVSDRREFLTVSAASALTILLTNACGGAVGGGGGGITGPVSFSILVSSYPTLANVGGIAGVYNGGAPIAVVRTGADTFSAYSLICPHRGCTVGITGSSFRCPCHGATFASSGRWTGGQQTSNLAAYGTSYDATTDTLTITN